MKRAGFYLLVGFALMATHTGYALAVDTQQIEKQMKELKEKEALEQFKGAGFGAGITLTLSRGTRTRVTSATIVNGVVRVTEDKNDIPRVMLETHYFFEGKNRFLGVPEQMWGWGPFIGIQNGADRIIEALGMGFMVGFRRAKDKADSFNFGIGAVADPSVRVLGDGVEENKPPPNFETEVRFKTTSKWGFLLLFSFGF